MHPLTTANDKSDTLVNPAFTASLVVAATRSTRAIGNCGALPWPSLPGDFAHFKSLTMGKPVVMGAATYLSLPPSVRPLPGRLNLVLSGSRSRQQLGLPDSVLLAGSLDAAEGLLVARGCATAFVIGGAQIYQAALKRPNWSARVHYTEVCAEFPADRFFPIDLRASGSAFSLVSLSADHVDNGITYRIAEFIRDPHVPATEPSTKTDTPLQAAADPPVVAGFVPKPSSVAHPHEELQYLALVRRILETGAHRSDRTGTGTLSVFGASMRFSLRDEEFPLLTTKRVFWRGVAEELFWFIRGSTDATALARKNVHIWDANGSKEFLAKRGLPERDEGDLGPVYGFQWRHFGAEYHDMYTDYSGKGVDQLAGVIRTIRENPNDRRILLCAWNPAALPLMALPPCHLLAQFYVANGELSCQMYQRSADMGLGVPFNIASYALLTRLIAVVTGLKAGEFVHVLGDAHVYSNHVEQLKEQIQREPRPFPKLKIKQRENIEEFTLEDLEIQGYDPHTTIKMDMAV